MFHSRQLAFSAVAAGVLALSSCDLTPPKYDETKPTLRLTVHDNATKKNTTVTAGNKGAPLKLSPGYDLMLTVNGVDDNGGMGELTVGVSHYQVTCSVKPNGPKQTTPASYFIDSQTVEGSKDANGKVKSQLIYVKFIKAAELDHRSCETLIKDGVTYFPTVDPGGLVEVHAYAKNFLGSQADLADWYLKRP